MTDFIRWGDMGVTKWGQMGNVVWGDTSGGVTTSGHIRGPITALTYGSQDEQTLPHQRDQIADDKAALRRFRKK